MASSACLQGEVLPIESAQFDGIYNVKTDAGLVLQVNHCDLQLLLNPWAECSSWVRDTTLASPLDCPFESPSEGPSACNGLDDPLGPLRHCDSVQQQQQQQQHHHQLQQTHTQQQQQPQTQQQPKQQLSVLLSGHTGSAYANTTSLSSLVQSVCQQQGLAGKQAAVRQSAQLQTAFADAGDTAHGGSLAYPPQSSAAAASLQPASAAAVKSRVAASCCDTQQGKDEKPVADAQKLGAVQTFRRRTKESVMARKRKLSEHSCGTIAEGGSIAVKSARCSPTAAASQGQPNTPTSLAKTDLGNGRKLAGDPTALFKSAYEMSHVSSPSPMPTLVTGTGHVSSPVSPSKNKGRPKLVNGTSHVSSVSVDNATANDAALARQLADEDFMDCLQQHEGSAEQPDGAKQHDSAKQEQLMSFDDDCDVDEYIDWAGISKKSPSTIVKDMKPTAHTGAQAAAVVTPDSKSTAKQKPAVSPSKSVKDSKPAVLVETKAVAAVTPNSKPVVKQKPVLSPQRKSSVCKTRAGSNAGLSKDSDDKAVIVLDSD